MAQTSSWVVADGSGAQVRAGFNTLVDVLRTANSGATAPSPTVGGMLWLDTGVSPAVIRMRNAANTAWIALTPETLPANSLWGNPGGSAAAPGAVSMAQLRTMLNFGQSHDANGWSRMGNGTILQWGTAVTVGAAGTTGAVINLPIAFPTGGLQVVASDGFGGAFSCAAQFVSSSQIRIWARDVFTSAYESTALRFLAVGH